MTQINFYSDIFGQSGYNNHSRQIVNALYKLNSQIYLESLKPHDWTRYVNTNEFNMLQNQPFDDAISIMINLPPLWKFPLSDKPKHFIGWCVWEGASVPKYWIDIFNMENISAIIVPSNHTLNAIQNTLKTSINPKIHVVSHGVNSSLFKPRTIEKPKDSKFIFIMNKGWAQGPNDRGGIQFGLKAFCDEFKNDKDVQMICKINTTYCPIGWNLDNEMAKIGLTPSDTKNVVFVLNNMNFDELPLLYQQGDVFVSPTMGDAFNLPCLEAMSCGLPVITTNFGGQTDYVNNNNGWLVDYDLTDVTWDVAYEGNSWALPKLEDLKKKMRYAYNCRNDIEDMKIHARKTAENYTWENSAKQLLNIINELE